MIRTIISLIVVGGAVLWLPVWIQAALFVGAIMWMHYRLLILIPAIAADVLYAPVSTFDIFHFKMTLFVGGLLFIWFVLVTQTRIGNIYAFTQK